MHVVKEYIEKNSSSLYLLLSLLLGSIIFIESFTYSGFFSSLIRLPISVWNISTVSIVLLLAISFFIKPTFSKIESFLFFSLVATLIGTTIFFSYLESTQFTNFVLSTFGFHLTIFYILSFFFWMSWGIGMFFFDKKKVVNIVLFLISGYGVLLGLRLMNPTLFELIGSEDQVIEWLSVLFLLVSSGAAAWQLRHPQPQSTWRKLLLVSIMVVTFFLAGEEISWGQRIFNIETPESLSEHNIQNETTIHNIGFIQDKMFFAYIIIGIVGSFGWLIKPFLVEKEQKLIVEIASFIPDKEFAFFFLPVFIYSLMRVIDGPVNYKTWEETAELLLFIGFSLDTQNNSEQMIQSDT